MPTIIKNGTIATAGETFNADLLVDNGVIAEIGVDLKHAGAKGIDARGLLVMPGGVDVHTHFNLDTGTAVAQDDYHSGTVAAAFGGTTTIVDHPGFGPPGCGLRHQVRASLQGARDNAVIDFGLHAVVQHVDDDVLQGLAGLHQQGIPSLKAYLTYGGRVSAGQLGLLLQYQKDLGGLVAVHAEDDALLRSHLDAVRRSGRCRDTAAYPLSRPAACEAEAVRQALALAAGAGDAPVYIVHLSTAAGLTHIRQARELRQKHIFAETCPQYLLLDESRYRLPRNEGLKYVMAPPLRTPDDAQALWQGLRDGEIDVVATDHCPFDFAKKKALGGEDFSRCPGGVPGVETRLVLLFSEGVVKKRISLNRFVDAVATAPARIMGLYPRKGAVRVGSDADLVLFDPRREETVAHKRLHQNVDYTPFEGLRVTGWPVLTMARGRVIVEGDRFVGKRGYGRFLQRGTIGLTR